MRDVIVGEELTTDYGLFDDYDGQMTCRCNTASCRHIIDGDDWRRRDLQLRYQRYFSWYLQRKISHMHDGADTPQFLTASSLAYSSGNRVVVQVGTFAGSAIPRASHRRSGPPDAAAETDPTI
jgi:hypothetical protein